MIKFVVVILLCAQAYARPNSDIDPFIIGGTPASEGQFPFIVSLKERSGYFLCGGALLSDTHVLTAAHCVVSKKPMKIGTGSTYRFNHTHYDVEEFIIHPRYERVSKGYDIAVLKLKTPVKMGGKVQTINFPVTENLDEKNVTALGWGYTSTHGSLSFNLLYLNRPIINNKDCAKRLETEIIDSQICLGSIEDQGMCFGDSGSPLLYKGPDGKNYVAGVVSWGVPCAKGYPDVFTRVSSFTDWIKENMR